MARQFTKTLEEALLRLCEGVLGNASGEGFPVESNLKLLEDLGVISPKTHLGCNFGYHMPAVARIPENNCFHSRYFCYSRLIGSDIYVPTMLFGNGGEFDSFGYLLKPAQDGLVEAVRHYEVASSSHDA